MDLIFTIDQSNDKKVTSFILPVSRTKKLINKKFKNRLFDKKIIITNLIKKIFLKKENFTKSI